jgi:predicted O-methyltransferase YrrM
VEYYGFDFFGEYRFHQVEQKLEKTGCTFKLFKGDTRDTLARAVKTLPQMDVIFIDGGKSYSEANNDWECSKLLMHDGTAVFVHNCDFSDVRRMVNNISRDKYQVEIIHPPYDSETALIKRRRQTRNFLR